VTLVAPREGAVEAGTPQSLAARVLQAASVLACRYEWALLAVVAAVGAVARLGFSHGTLFRDDAWVALTTRVPLGTAARMVVTTPGFVLAERAWIGWFPHSVAMDQLPTYVASVAGIIAVGRLARWWGLSAPASLLAAGVIAVASSDVTYATRVKPYAFDLLGAVLVLWLAEKVRREGSRAAPWLAVASFAVCAFSLTPVPLVLAVWVALGVDAAIRRRLGARLVLAGAATALSLGALWLAVRGGVSPRLRASWHGNYLVVTSPHGLVHSVRAMTNGFVAGIGVTTPAIGLHGLGTLDRAAIIVLAVCGLVAWRRQLLCVAAIVGAVIVSIPTLDPLGTGRTDAYLYPAIALLIAEGAMVLWRVVRRAPDQAAIAVLAASIAFAGVMAADRVLHRPSYPGGNFAPVAAIVHKDLGKGELVVIGGTARWPWTYYDVSRVRIRFSHLYNNGYTTLSDSPSVVVVPGTPIEGGYASAVERVTAQVASHAPGVLYVESDDWPTMPMSLLLSLEGFGEGNGRLSVARYFVEDGYRFWELVPASAVGR
jgi:hypothetical protein